MSARRDLKNFAWLTAGFGFMVLVLLAAGATRISKSEEVKSAVVQSMVAVIAAGSALAGAILVLYFRPRIDQEATQERELVSLNNELPDLARHLVANNSVIKAMLAQRKADELPLRMHVDKFQIPDDFLVFSKETFKNFPPQHMSQLNKMKLRMRNYNITNVQLIDLLDKQKIDLFYAVLKFQLNRGEILIILLGKFHQTTASLNQVLDISAFLDEYDKNSFEGIFFQTLAVPIDPPALNDGA